MSPDRGDTSPDRGDSSPEAAGGSAEPADAAAEFAEVRAELVGEEREQEVRPLPVVREPRPVDWQRPRPLPATIVAATGGFLAGVAAFVLVRVLRRPRGRRITVAGRGRDQGIDVAATRSFLVDIHLLKR